MEYLCHDIKTERRDVSSGLPQGLKIVPVLFYITMVACTALYCFFETSRNQAEHELVKWRDAATKFNQETASIAQERKVIETANTWANGVAKWLEGAHNLQPLLVALGRGVGADATISEVLMTRNTEIASQIQFTLKMNDVTSQVLDRTLEGIRKLDFRAYSAQQQKEGDTLDYNAILVFQPGEESAPRTVAKSK